MIRLLGLLLVAEQFQDEDLTEILVKSRQASLFIFVDEYVEIRITTYTVPCLYLVLACVDESKHPAALHSLSNLWCV